DPKVILIDTSSWGIRGGADGLHPDPQAHERASELLLETLKPYLAPAETGTAAPEETAAPTYSVVTPSSTEVGPKRAGSAALPLAIAGGAVIAAALAAVGIAAVNKRKR
ncbi:MAG: hypothetical protein J6X19_07320, partial [Clostridia bacterium]|nr:hypothetical protein [Clostridia bacterium]